MHIYLHILCTKAIFLDTIFSWKALQYKKRNNWIFKILKRFSCRELLRITCKTSTISDRDSDIPFCNNRWREAQFCCQLEWWGSASHLPSDIGQHKTITYDH